MKVIVMVLLFLLSASEDVFSQRYIIPADSAYINVLLSDTLMGYGYLGIVTIQDPSGKKRQAIIEAQTVCSILYPQYNFSKYYHNAGPYFRNKPLRVKQKDMAFFRYFVEKDCSPFSNISRDSLVTIFRKSKKNLNNSDFRCLIKELITNNVLVAKSEGNIGLALPMKD